MRASAEISMYPLNEDYEGPILDFIRRLDAHEGITAHSNAMSTQVFGEYDLLMKVLTEEIKAAFEQEPAVVMVMKVVNADLSSNSSSRSPTRA